jgi:hypothetical protein
MWKISQKLRLPRPIRLFLSLERSQYGSIVFPFFCHFERSEKSLFRPEEEICLKSLAFARDDNPKLKHCDTVSKRVREIEDETCLAPIKF